MFQVELLLVLLLQTQVAASRPGHYATDFSYDRLDCQSGKKIAKETVPTGTLVSIIGVAEKRMRVLEIVSSRESCINAREKDLIRVEPVKLPDGSVAGFMDARSPTEPPQVRAPASRTPLSLTASDSPDTTLPEAIIVFAVATDGSVHGCRVLRSSHSTGWDNWARAVACDATYLAARRNGEAVAVTVIQRVPLGRR